MCWSFKPCLFQPRVPRKTELKQWRELGALAIPFFKILIFYETFTELSWGISSNDRAPASHAGGTGIDARILHNFLLFADHYLNLESWSHEKF